MIVILIFPDHFKYSEHFQFSPSSIRKKIFRHKNKKTHQKLKKHYNIILNHKKYYKLNIWYDKTQWQNLGELVSVVSCGKSQSFS